MKKRPSDIFTQDQRAELAELAELPDDQIDIEDIPEIVDWQGARRSIFYRPMQQEITLHLDADLIAWFKSQSEGTNGNGYQAKINHALRTYMEWQVSNRE